jgi:mRNA interferase RelE/StbE
VARFEVLIKPSAVKEIEALSPRKLRQQIVRRIQALATEPRPPGCQKLSGRERYRVRQGAWRIVYGIDDIERIVIVVRVAHRGDVYRRE